MLTAAKEGTFSASSDPCVFFPLAASGVYPKTRVWGSEPENVHSSSATAPLKIEQRWGCEESSSKTALGSGVSFKYDPFGRRIYKSSSSSGASVYAYDSDNVIEETNASGAVVARYSQGLNIDEPLAMLRSGATSFYNADGLGTVTSLSNATGSLVQTYVYDSFGKQTNSSGPLINPFRYTAREFDSETGLYYYRARYYDTEIGRFASEDPRGFGGGLNHYTYVHNHLPNATDPTGEYIKVYGNSQDWVKALFYLSKVPAARDAIVAIAKSPLDVTIIVDPSLPCDASIGLADYAELTGIIRWNPHCASECDGRNLQSPALILFHELSHEYLFQQKHFFDSREEEENYIIQNMETPVARALGEGTRTSHGTGNPVPVPTPINH